MRFLDYFRSAFKNLVRHKVRTLLTIVAITIGSLSVILMVSLLTSIRQSVYDFFGEMDAFTLVTVTPDPNAAGNGGFFQTGDTGNLEEGKILDDAVITTLRAIPHVIDATPIGGGLGVKNIRLEGQEKKMWANFMSYDPGSNVFSMPLTAGRALTRDDMDKVVVSTRFAKTYGYSGNPEALIGQRLILMFQGGDMPDWGDLTPEKPPEGDSKDWWEEQQKKSIEISAVIIGVAASSSFEDSQNLINITWAQKLMTHVRWEWQSKCTDEQMRQMREWEERLRENPRLKEPNPFEGVDCSGALALTKSDDFIKNGYAAIMLKTDSTDTVQEVADTIGKMGYGVSSAQDMLKEMNKMLLGIGAVLGIIGGISLFVAAIGIINTMVMAGYERIREIGVMRACGATRKTIRRLFTFEAALLGFLGGLFGFGLSYAIGNAANYVADRYVSSIDLPFDQVATFPWWLIVSVLAFTTLIGLLSGLGPAIRSSRLNPVDALRYE